MTTGLPVRIGHRTAPNAMPARRVSALIPNRQNDLVTPAPTRIRPQKLQPPRTVLSLVITIRPHCALFSPQLLPHPDDSIPIDRLCAAV